MARLSSRPQVTTGPLSAYVRAGGTLLWAAGVAGPAHRALTGLSLSGNLLATRAWAQEGNTSTVVREPLLVVEATLLPGANVSRLASSVPLGLPVAVEHRLGAGRVITCLVPWWEAGSAGLARLSAALLDAAMARVQAVRVEGLPVAWAVAVPSGMSGGRTVTLSNNEAAVWRGSLVLAPARLRCGPAYQCRALGPSGRCVDTVQVGRPGEDVPIRVEMPAYAVGVFQLSCVPVEGGEGRGGTPAKGGT